MVKELIPEPIGGPLWCDRDRISVRIVARHNEPMVQPIGVIGQRIPRILDRLYQDHGKIGERIDG